MGAEQPPPQQPAIILHGFSNQDIDLILRSIKQLFIPKRDIVFAKTTPTSLKMRLETLIADISEDHQYLRNNPPRPPKKESSP